MCTDLNKAHSVVRWKEMDEHGQSENAHLRRIIMNIATDLRVIEKQFRKLSEPDETKNCLADLLKRSSMKLLAESSFMEMYRPLERTLTPDEWKQELAKSTDQSIAEVIPVLAGAFDRTRDVENVSSPVRQLELPQREVSSVVARLGGGDDSEGDSDGGSRSSSSSESTASEIDVLAYFDRKAKARAMHQRLVERVESAYFNASTEVELLTAHDFYLMFEKYDVWSPNIIARCDFSQNKSSISMLERQALAFFTAIQDRMPASMHAKNARRQLLEKEYADLYHDLETTGSCAMALLERAEIDLNETNDDDEQENELYHVAAELAAEEACVASSWIDLVSFQRPMISQMRRIVIQKIMSAVLQLTPFNEIAEKAPESIRAFLDDKCPDWRDSSQSTADAWDSLICPLLQVGVPDADVQKAYASAVFLSQRLSFAQYATHFQKAEAILLSQLLEDCDAGCLQSFKRKGLKSYFLAENSQVENKVKLGQDRRLIATRCFLLPVTFKSALQRIQDDDVLSDGVYGVNCMAPSCFKDKKYKLLWDKKALLDFQPEHHESIKNLIKSILGVGDAALEAFQEDFLILDLTSDIKNNTDNSLRHLKEYFNLCIPSDAIDAIEL